MAAVIHRELPSAEHINISLRCVGTGLEKIFCVSKFASDNQCYFAISTVEETQILIKNMVRSVLISLFVKLGHGKKLEKQTFVHCTFSCSLMFEILLALPLIKNKL